MTTKDAVYNYIVDYALKHNRLPNQNEIAEACYITRNSVGYVLDKLVAEDKVKLKDGKLATYTITGINYKDEREVAN